MVRAQFSVLRNAVVNAGDICFESIRFALQPVVSEEYRWCGIRIGFDFLVATLLPIGDGFVGKIVAGTDRVILDRHPGRVRVPPDAGVEPFISILVEETLASRQLDLRSLQNILNGPM